MRQANILTPEWVESVDWLLVPRQTIGELTASTTTMKRMTQQANEPTGRLTNNNKLATWLKWVKINPS